MRRAGLPADGFLWAFGGNLGLAQGLDTAIDAARLLGPEFTLLLLGDGAAARRSSSVRASWRLAECCSATSCRRTRPPTCCVCADALLVSLSADPMLSTFVPSKLFDFCALGRPVVLAAAGEPQRLAGEAGAALAVPPGDSIALAQAVRSIRDDESLAPRLVANARRFAVDNLRERHLSELETELVRATT